MHIHMYMLSPAVPGRDGAADEGQKPKQLSRVCTFFLLAFDFSCIYNSEIFSTCTRSLQHGHIEVGQGPGQSLQWMDTAESACLKVGRQNVCCLFWGKWAGDGIQGSRD